MSCRRSVNVGEVSHLADIWTIDTSPTFGPSCSSPPVAMTIISILLVSLTQAVALQECFNGEQRDSETNCCGTTHSCPLSCITTIHDNSDPNAGRWCACTHCCGSPATIDSACGTSAGCTEFIASDSSGPHTNGFMQVPHTQGTCTACFGDTTACFPSDEAFEGCQAIFLSSDRLEQYNLPLTTKSPITGIDNGVFACSAPHPSGLHLASNDAKVCFGPTSECCLELSEEGGKAKLKSTCPLDAAAPPSTSPSSPSPCPPPPSPPPPSPPPPMIEYFAYWPSDREGVCPAAFTTQSSGVRCGCTDFGKIPVPPTDCGTAGSNLGIGTLLTTQTMFDVFNWALDTQCASSTGIPRWNYHTDRAMVCQSAPSSGCSWTSMQYYDNKGCEKYRTFASGTACNDGADTSVPVTSGEQADALAACEDDPTCVGVQKFTCYYHLCQAEASLSNSNNVAYLWMRKANCG